MKKFLTVALSALLLAASVPFATAAAAAESPVDLVSVSLPKRLEVSGSGCRNIPIRYSIVSAPGFDPALSSAEMPLLKNGGGHDLLFLDGAQTLSTWTWCPFFDGVGKYQIGMGFTDGLNLTTLEEGPWEDTTQSNVLDFRYHSRIKMWGTFSGSNKSIEVITTRFDINTGGYSRWTAPKYTVQRLRADGTWATIATMKRLGVGRFTYKFKSSKTATYRVISANSSTTWGRTTGNLTF